MRYCRFIVLMFLLSLSAYSWAKPVTITFWHAMAGQWGGYVDHIVQLFNRSQSDYRVVSVYKGSYPETLTSTVAAFRADQAPNLVQVFEVGTATMMNPPGVIIPVHQLFASTGVSINTQDILPAIKGYYSDNQGRLMALPFNSSTAVLFYNRDAFKRAGLNPDTPPKTWPDLARDAKKLLASGMRCGFTTTFPSWTQLEVFSAWHDIPLATFDNGFASLNARMTFDNPIVIHHIATLEKWQRQGIFQYGGRDDNAMALFSSGQCAMIIESSGSILALPAILKFKIGIGPLPYWPNVKGAPQNSIIGGGAIWVLSGHSKAENKAAAAFLQFLLTPKIQAYWQRKTGYLAVTFSAHQLAKQQGFYRQHPGAKIPFQMLNHKPPKPFTRGLRLGNYTQIRQINAQALESVWSGMQTAEEALHEAVRKDNALLKRFQRQVKVN